MSEGCNLEFSEAENYVPEPFENTFSINFYHDKVPRFGNKNELIVLVKGSEEEKAEYVRGILASAICFFVIFLLWSIALCVFKCMGPKKVGWKSGSRVPLPPKPSPKAVENEDDKEDSSQATVVASVDKADRSTTAGLSLGRTREGAIVIYGIADNGLFSGSPLKVGQRLISINEVKCTDDLNESVALIQKAEGTLTIQAYQEVDDEDLEVVQWESEYQRVEKQHTKFKIVIMVALFMIILMGFVLCAAGVRQLTDAVSTGIDTFDIVDVRINQGIDFVDDVLNAITTVKSDIANLLEKVNGICPKQTQKICQDLTDPASCQTNGTLGFVSSLQNTISFLNQDGDMQNMLQDVRDDLENRLQPKVQSVSDDAVQLDIALWLAMAFSIVLSILCISFMVTMLFKMPRCVKCVQLACTYPFFFLMVFLSFLFSLIFVVASLAVSDVCYESPDSRVEALLDSSDAAQSEIVREAIRAIFSGCTSPPERIITTLDVYKNGVSVFDGLLSSLDEFESVRVGVCGESNWTIAGAADVIDDKINGYLCGTFGILSSLRDILSCRFWYPIYQNAVHSSLCYEGNDGFAAISSSQFVVVFMAYIVLTFRVALWDIEISEEEDQAEKGRISGEEEDDQAEEGAGNEAGDDGKEETAPVVAAAAEEVDSEKANGQDIKTDAGT